jgi:hypothetical protein
MLMQANDQARTATVPLIFIYFFFYDFAYTSMLVLYTLEILPYNIRAKGFAIMVGRFRSVSECCLTSRTEYCHVFDQRF